MSTYFFRATIADKDLNVPDAPPPQPGELYFHYTFVLNKKTPDKISFAVQQSSQSAKQPNNIPLAPGDITARKLPEVDPTMGIYIVRARVAPGTRVTVTVTIPGEAGFPRQDTFSFDPPANTASPVPLMARSENLPRLVVALNSSYVPEARNQPLFRTFRDKKGADFDFAEPGSFEIRYLISHIYERLRHPFSADPSQSDVSPPWLGADGGALATTPFVALPADERWARLMAEMFTLTPYTTPSTAYQSLVGLKYQDEHLMYKMQDNEDPAYPIVGECQHQVTAAAIGRGFSFNVVDKQGTDTVTRRKLKTMFTAGPSGGAVKEMIPRDQVDWFTPQASTTELSRLDTKFQPGSSFAFNDAKDGTQHATSHPHIAYAIRVQRSPQGMVQRIQYFDVNGMNVPEPSHPAMPMPVKNPEVDVLSYEYPWSTTGKAGAIGSFAGLASLHPSADTLEKGIQRLAASRPLGVARLVLARRVNPVKKRPVDLKSDPLEEWLLYASPLLRMYENDKGQNYAITRYLWSLRELPGAEHILAIWMISSVRGELLDTMAFGLGPAANRRPTGRTVKLAEMMQDVAQRLSKKTKPITIDTTGAKPLPVQMLTLGVIDVAARADGSVAVIDACKSNFKTANFTHVVRDDDKIVAPGASGIRKLPWGQATTKAASVELSTFGDIPAYFREVT